MRLHLRTHEPTAEERLAEIVQTCLDIGVEPTAEVVENQFKYEVGCLPDAGLLARAIGKA